MFKLIAALVAVAAAGLGGAILVPRAEAQAVDEPVDIIQETAPARELGELHERIQLRRAAEEAREDARWATKSEFLDKQFAELGRVSLQKLLPGQARPAANYVVAPYGQSGTWQIVSHDKLALLLNTASGETFVLREEEGKLNWKPIPRPETLAKGWTFRSEQPAPIFPAPKAEARRDIEPARRLEEIGKQIDRIEKELGEIQRRLENADADEKAKLREKRRALEKDLDDLEAELERKPSAR